jgi:hypothetical protein
MRVLSRVDFPAPFRPSRARISCCAIERDVCQDVALAVERVHARGGEEGFRLGRALPWARRDGCGPRPDIDLLHLRAGAGVLDGAVDEDATLVHDGHGVRDLEDAIDVVLDEEHRQVCRDALDDVADALALGGGQPGKRLIQQQHARPRGEGEPHVEQALPAIGQGAGLGLLHTATPDSGRGRWSRPRHRSRARAAVQGSKRRCGAPDGKARFSRRQPGKRFVIWNERRTRPRDPLGDRPAIERPAGGRALTVCEPGSG